MAFELSLTDVWAAELRNRPGELAHLLERLAHSGAALEFIVARPSDAGSTIVFLAPLLGDAQLDAAKELGLHRSDTMHVVRVAAPDQPGLMARMMRTLSSMTINVRGLTASVINGKSVVYIRFESADDAQRGKEAMKKTLQ